jgi:hypothetical protein
MHPALPYGRIAISELDSDQAVPGLADAPFKRRYEASDPELQIFDKNRERLNTLAYARGPILSKSKAPG